MKYFLSLITSALMLSAASATTCVINNAPQNLLDHGKISGNNFQENNDVWTVESYQPYPGIEGGQFRVQCNDGYILRSYGRTDHQMSRYIACATTHDDVRDLSSRIEGLTCEPNRLRGTAQNISLSKPTTQSTTSHGGVSSRAVDGNTDGSWKRGSVTHTRESTDPYWEVNLEDIYTIDTIKVYNRIDCCTTRLTDFTVTIYNTNGVQVWSKLVPGNAPYLSTISVPSIEGSIVRISLSGASRTLSLAQVEVF
jgi:hypothetical protein